MGFSKEGLEQIKANAIVSLNKVREKRAPTIFRLANDVIALVSYIHELRKRFPGLPLASLRIKGSTVDKLKNFAKNKLESVEGNHVCGNCKNDMRTLAEYVLTLADIINPEVTNSREENVITEVVDRSI